MTPPHRPSRLEHACDCRCHRWPNVSHLLACCSYGPIEQHEYDELRAFDGPYFS